MDQKYVSSSPALSFVRRITIANAVLACVALAGCGRHGAASLTDPAAVHAAARASAGGTTLATAAPVHLEGTIGPGAQWEIDRPAEWNGDLVVWLHGYSNPAGPVTLPAFAPFRDALLAQGYAVVASSYSSNGYAVQEATIQSHQLRGLFVSKLGQPRRTYLVGVSLGGLVGALMAERYPEQYDGALLVSGVVAGSDDELTYVGDVRVLFDAVYPGVLPGTLLHVPAGLDVNQALGAAQHAIQTNPQGIGIIYALARVKPEGANGSDIARSILTAIGFQLQGANDLLSRTHGHSFFDNATWRYAGPLPGALVDQINEEVARYTATPDARAYVQHYGEPKAAFRIPVITMHNQWDPVVPYAQEPPYHALAVGAGTETLLLQRTVGRYGHVAVTPAELTGGLTDLAQWVDTGIRPVQ